MRHTLPVLGSVGVGVLSAIQARVNGELSGTLDNGLQAAVWSFGSGWVILLVIAMLSPSIRAGVRRVVLAVRTGQLKWWQVLGGMLGGYYVASQSIAVPLVGVALFTVAVVAGQSGSSLIVDRVGLGPAGRQAISARRVTAAILAVLAVAVAVSERLRSADPAVVALTLALAAGIGIAIQQAINGRVGLAARSAMSATLINFTFGGVVLWIGLLVATFVAHWPLGALFSAPWWAYGGGVIGIAFIAVSAWAVPIVGVLRFALLSIAGQLFGALLLDLVFPAPGAQVSVTLVIGVLLAFVAVAVSSVRPGSSQGAASRSV